MKRYNKTRKVRGGQCGPNMCQLGGNQRVGVMNPTWGGGACPCQAVPPLPTPLGGGYRPTNRDLKYLKMWKQGKSIGFTLTSSLRAKGLIPRANGTKRVSNKYRK